ncbi:MAG: Cell division protein FtsZ [Verrucomicrobiales bacterium]|nr:Cell division protein FtsZ [Verrucomicrobiales bacterium]
MIQFHPDPAHGPDSSSAFSVSVIGIGGAGTSVIDQLAIEGVPGTEIISMNCDARALAASTAGRKIQLGETLTLGLGCGGDPELGEEAAGTSSSEIRDLLKGRSMVFLCVGLGGGTGSGAAPLVARMARECGAFVVVFATLPFGFEGRRRTRQAVLALNDLRKYANALITFENDRMGELVVPKKGVQEAFEAADKIIGQSIRAVTSLVTQPGLIHIGMDELITALRNTDSRCLFGFGQAKGENRAVDALALALRSPLLDRGQMAANARNVLVHICGGSSLTLFEIETLMRELGKDIHEEAQILFGAAIDNSLNEHLSVTILTSLGKNPPETEGSSSPKLEEAVPGRASAAGSNASASSSAPAASSNNKGSRDTVAELAGPGTAEVEAPAVDAEADPAPAPESLQAEQVIAPEPEVETRIEDETPVAEQTPDEPAPAPEAVSAPASAPAVQSVTLVVAAPVPVTAKISAPAVAVTWMAINGATTATGTSGSLATYPQPLPLGTVPALVAAAAVSSTVAETTAETAAEANTAPVAERVKAEEATVPEAETEATVESEPQQGLEMAEAPAAAASETEVEDVVTAAEEQADAAPEEAVVEEISNTATSHPEGEAAETHAVAGSGGGFHPHTPVQQQMEAERRPEAAASLEEEFEKTPLQGLHHHGRSTIDPAAGDEEPLRVIRIERVPARPPVVMQRPATSTPAPANGQGVNTPKRFVLTDLINREPRPGAAPVPPSDRSVQPEAPASAPATPSRQPSPTATATTGRGTSASRHIQPDMNRLSAIRPIGAGRRAPAGQGSHAAHSAVAARASHAPVLAPIATAVTQPPVRPTPVRPQPGAQASAPQPAEERRSHPATSHPAPKPQPEGNEEDLDVPTFLRRKR